MVKFTIQPGDTQEDLVTTLCDSLDYLEREELEKVLQTYDFSDFSFLKDLPERNYRLEGYLLPGEYETYNGESALAVVRRKRGVCHGNGGIHSTQTQHSGNQGEFVKA